MCATANIGRTDRQASSFGDVPTSMSRQERDAESAKEKQHRDRIRAMARKYSSQRSVGVKFSISNRASLL